MLNWGFDYDMARALVAPMGVSLNKNLTLEFPSGSMFWGRTDTLRPLLQFKTQVYGLSRRARSNRRHDRARNRALASNDRGVERL